jgi:hypothetical protein
MAPLPRHSPVGGKYVNVRCFESTSQRCFEHEMLFGTNLFVCFQVREPRFADESLP